MPSSLTRKTKLFAVGSTTSSVSSCFDASSWDGDQRQRRWDIAELARKNNGNPLYLGLFASCWIEGLAKSISRKSEGCYKSR